MNVKETKSSLWRAFCFAIHQISISAMTELSTSHEKIVIFPEDIYFVYRDDVNGARPGSTFLAYYLIWKASITYFVDTDV